MDRSHFGSFCTSFRSLPPAGLRYFPQSRRDLIDVMVAALGAARPVLILSGDPGVGKTILARQLADRCAASDPQAAVALIGHSRVHLLDLPRQVPKAFGLSHDPAFDDAERGAGTARDVLRDAGGRALLIVDEAQALTDAGLDYLARLTGAEDGKTGPVSILLVDGGGDLDKRLAGHDGLRARIGGRFRLASFSETETADYVAHRFRVSGCSCHAGVQVFDPDGLRHLHALSGGVPRIIDTLVQHCLFQAGMAEQTAMDGAFVRSCLSALAQDGGLAHLVVPARPRPTPARPEVLAAPVAETPVGPDPPASRPGPTALPDRPWTRAAPAMFWKAGLAATAVGLLILVPVTDSQREPVETASLLPLAPLLATAMQDDPATGKAPGDTAVAVMPPAPVAAPIPLMPGRVAVEARPDPDRLLSEGLAVGGADPARAARLYARAALWGSDRAAYYLGQLHETGIGVAVDTDRAQAWYEQAHNLRGAAARLAHLQAVAPPAAFQPPLAPVPVRQVLFKGGETELHWHAAPGTAPRFRVEYVLAGGQGQVRSLDTGLSGALIAQPVMGWRVAVLHRDGTTGPASPWSRPVPAAR